MPKVCRALISVYDKTGLVDLARELVKLRVEIISTGGTAKHLNEHGISTTSISEITRFPEILSGRVKTLHPRVFAGILSLRDDAGHQRQMAEHDLHFVDLVVVNLYPFAATVAREDVSESEVLENIDIGGPSLIRAAAKNYQHVGVVTSPHQYAELIDDLNRHEGALSEATRRRFATEAFKLTSGYDGAIHAYFSAQPGKRDTGKLPQEIGLTLTKVSDLRYGENPHQRAAVYSEAERPASGLLRARQLHGKELSYNNLLDVNTAIGIVQEFDEPCVAIVKHNNPCGVATATRLADAYENAKATDPVSAFGSIVGLNQPLDIATAHVISEIFTEVIVAPAFESDALKLLQSQKNLRLLELPELPVSDSPELQLTRVRGGLLVQDQDFLRVSDTNLRAVSRRQPDDRELLALKFGWRVCKWVKSNAIVFSGSDRTLGIGAGQMSRVDAVRIAADKARELGLKLQNSVLASDAFFPFKDGVDMAAHCGVTAIIQPGGSIRDQEVIAAADEHGIAMVFTGVRHFRH